jgi:hypothetical protein
MVRELVTVLPLLAAALLTRPTTAAVLFRVADPVEPGSTAVLYGGGLAGATSVTACALGGAPGGCASLPTLQAWEGAVKAQLPAGGEAAIFNVSVGGGNGLLLNAPRLQWWVGERAEADGQAVVGETLHVFGVSLAWDAAQRNCPTLSLGALPPGAPAQPPPAGVAALLVDLADPTKQTSLAVLAASCYRLDLAVPPSLAPANYSLFVNNGLWRSWSPPDLATLPPPLIASVAVVAQPEWPADFFTVGSSPNCATVPACLAACAAAGGGTVALPAGNFSLLSGQALVLGARVQLVGAGQDLAQGGSALVWAANAGGPQGAGAWVTGGAAPWRVANLLIVHTSGMFGAPAILIPALSVGVRVEDVTVKILTTGGQSVTGTGITVGEGPNNEGEPGWAAHWAVTGSTFFQDAAVNCPINPWPRDCGFYFVQARMGVFRNNTFESGCQGWAVIDASGIFMADLSITSIGQNSDGNGFSNFYFPEVLENIYIGNTINTGNYLSTERWETMTFDGLSVYWNGGVVSGSANSLVLPSDPINPRNNYEGAAVVVVGGAGIGQMKRVVGYSRGPGGQSTWTLDTPWDVPLNGTGEGASVIVITGFRGLTTFEANSYINGTNFQV